MSYDSREIANFTLDYSEEKQLSITIMTLLKIIYFAHGWNFIRSDTPLIKEPFEAWENGPVVRVVWEAFRGQGSARIITRAKRLDPLTQRKSIVPYEIAEETADFIRFIIDTYGKYTAFQLSNMTHEQGSPWDRVWNAPNGKVRAGMFITNEEIKKFFRDRARTLPQH